MAKTYYASPTSNSHSRHRKILINYADENLSQAQKINAETGRLYGKFDEVICYGPQDIDAGFYEKNRSILTEKRGAGYWLWKPYVILKTLRRMKDGDYLFYADAGSFFIAPIDPLIHAIEKMKHGIAVCVHKKKVKKHTKRDVLILMQMDKPNYLDEWMVHSSTMLLKKSDKNMDFIEQWLKLCCDRRLVTDDQNVMGKPNHPEFAGHDHDQSILTLLCIKHGLMGCGYMKFDQPIRAGKALMCNMDCFIPVVSTRRRNTNCISATIDKLLWMNVPLIRLIMRVSLIIQSTGGMHTDEHRLGRNAVRKWLRFSASLSNLCDRLCARIVRMNLRH